MFPDDDEAAKWLESHSSGSFTTADSYEPRPQSSAPYEINLDQPRPELAEYGETIMFMPDDRPLGPFVSNQGALVSIKEKTDLRLAPLDAVRGEIHAKRMREKLDDLEHRLAKEWAPKFRVIDQIPYAAFGVEKANIAPR